MADNRRFADLHLGQPGLLTYIPSEEPENNLGALHTARLTSNAPQFRIVGSTAELYAPSRPIPPSLPSKSRDQLKVQGRWLANSHPEAFIGGTHAFAGVLQENLNRSEQSENLEDKGKQLALGDMTDMRIPSRPTAMPVLAVVTGESGQKLRLASVEQSQWQWDENEAALLNLSVIDPAQQENETIWIGDGLPIANVRFASSYWQSGKARWLLVQTKTSVTILQPEFHPVPVPDQAGPHSEFFQPPSYIAVNPLVTLRHHETGGNEISDFWLNPAPIGFVPQLGVIDQCGYWSVWSLLGTWSVSINTLRLSLYKCGHISEGFLASLPPPSNLPAQRHGMLRIGQLDLNDSSGAPMKREKEVEGVRGHSQQALIWNAQQLVLVDLDTDRIFPKLDIVRSSRLAPDWILDVMISPSNGDQVFVLTARQIIWLEMSPNQGNSARALRPTILVACFHIGFGNENSRISVGTASDDDPNSTMVFIHSPRMDQLTVYWFNITPETRLPQYHRHITSLSTGDSMRGLSKTRSIMVHPAQIDTFGPADETGTEAEYLNNVKFYQMTLLGEDLSVRYCVCTSSSMSVMDVSLPTIRVAWSPQGELKRWKRKRKRFLKHLGDTFVIPDGMTDQSLETLLRRKRTKNQNDETLDDVESDRPRPVLLKMNRICHEIASQLQTGLDRGPTGLPADLATILRSVIERGVAENEPMPLTSWNQLFSDIREPISYAALEDSMEEDIKNLLGNANDQVVVIQLRRRMADELPDSPLLLRTLLGQFSDLWLKPVGDSLPLEVQRARYVWVSELARDVFLSSYGLMFQDVSLLETSIVDTMENIRLDGPSQQSSQLTQRSSRISSSPPVGSVSSQEASNDAAFQRLRLLAPTLEQGTLGLLKPPKTLSYWPTELGVDTDDYVSSIAVAEEQKVSHIKQRLRKFEAKKKAQAEKYKLPPFMRQGFPASDHMREEDAIVEARRQPAMHTMSSQRGVPDSSQSFGVAGPSLTMSQPVSGVFGDRKKVKKGKRKSGFR